MGCVGEPIAMWLRVRRLIGSAVEDASHDGGDSEEEGDRRSPRSEDDRDAAHARRQQQRRFRLESSGRDHCGAAAQCAAAAAAFAGRRSMRVRLGDVRCVASAQQPDPDVTALPRRCGARDQSAVVAAAAAAAAVPGRCGVRTQRCAHTFEADLHVVWMVRISTPAHITPERDRSRTCGEARELKRALRSQHG